MNSQDLINHEQSIEIEEKEKEMNLANKMDIVNVKLKLINIALSLRDEPDRLYSKEKAIQEIKQVIRALDRLDLEQ